MMPVVDCRRRPCLWKLSAVAVFMLAAFIAQLLSTSPALGQQPEPQSADHAALVKQLGDDRYAVREQAARTLLEAGESAQTALRAGLADEDPQRRRSCRRILAQVASATVRQRLDSVNPDELPGIEWMSELPGWDRYARIIGTDNSSRQLFLDMQKQEPALFASLEDGPRAAADAVNTRFFQVHSRAYSRMTMQRKPPSLGTMAALVFICSDQRLKIPRELFDHYSWYSLLQQTSMRQALTTGSQQSAARSILGLWIGMPGGANVAYNKLRMGIRYPVPEALDLALVVLEQKDLGNGNLYGFAMQSVGVLGGRSYSRVIAGLLDNETVVSRRTVIQNEKRIAIDIELRDVALGWLIFLTGQNHGDYWMPRASSAFGRLRQSPTANISVSLMSYDQTGRREEAMAKWQKFVSEHPLPEFPSELVLQSPASIRRGPGQAALDEVIKRIKAAVPRSINPPAPGTDTRAADTKPARQRPRPRILPGEVNKPRPLPGQKSADPVMIPGLPIADRDMTRRLILARKAIRQDELADAVLLLGDVLAQQQDFTFRDDRLVPVSQGLKAAVQRMIEDLPERGRGLYEEHFGSQAQKQLDEAVSAGQLEQLLSISSRFFHTRAGAEASYLAGIRLLEENRPLHAAMLLDRLLDRSHHRATLQPDLSLQLAIGWARAGLPARARRVLRELERIAPQLELSVAGKKQKLFSPNSDALEQLAHVTGPVASSLHPQDWPLYRGNWQRNQLSPSDGPYLSADVLLNVSSSSLVLNETRRLEKKYRAEYKSVLPSLQPLVVGDTILVRTATHLTALSASKGEILWQSEFFDDLFRLSDRSADQWDDPDLAMMRRGLELRLWNNPTYGTISSDGKQVYGVEGLGFSEVPLSQQLVVAADGTRRLDPGMLKTYNQLVAHDLVTGKVRWELGGAIGSGRELEGVFFLGPPLPFGGRLFVIGRRRGYVSLLELDSASGKLIWEKTLAICETLPVISQQPGIPPIWGVLSETWRCGGSPSYSQGVLVCPLSDRSIAAVDLTSQSMLWIYQQQSTEGAYGSRMAQLRLMAIQSNVQGLTTSWADNSVTISDGRVLLTPANSERLFCLDLATGQVQWSRSRKDSWYVAGVEQGVIYLVGHRGIRALKLSDGRSSWQTEHAPFPPGAAPSGRGYLAEGRLYVPLSIGEVIAFDTSNGRLASRSRSFDDQVPGNLVRCHDRILSQTASGLWNFEPLEQRRDRIVAKLADRPNDPELLVDHGELLLYSGKIQAAIDRLSEVLKGEANPRASHLLSLALVDGLHADFDTFQQRVQQLLPQLSTSKSDASFLKELVQVYQKGGDSVGATSACLLLASRDDELVKMEFVDSVRQIRRDRWIQTRLAQIWSAADEQTHPQLLALLKRHAEQFEGAIDLYAALPIAPQLWLTRSITDLEQKRFANAEFLLRRVMFEGTAVQQREAIARLATLYQASGQHGRSAAVFQLLATELADQVCLAGMTGRQLSDARPADDPSRKPVQQIPTAEAWPNRTPHLRETRASPNSFSYHYPIMMREREDRFLEPIRLEIDSVAHKVTALGPLGQQRWELNAVSGSNSIPYRGPNYHRMQGFQLGSIVIVCTGDRVFALETSEKSARLKWSQDTYEDPNAWQMQFGMNQFGIRVLQNMARPLPAGEHIPLHVTPDLTCFQRGQELVAIQTDSGEIAWRRRDLPIGCDLFGDHEMLFVTSPDSQDCQVLRLRDGEEIGQRQLPAVSQRVATRGRQVLSWRSDKDGSSFELIDAWERKEIWSRQFAAGTLPWMVNRDEVAAIALDGTLTVLDTGTGQQLIQSQVRLPEGITGVAVFHGQGRYLVTTEKNEKQLNQINNPTLASGVLVHGTVTSLDDKSGEIVWSREVLEQTIRMDRVKHLPLLLFTNQVRSQDEKGRTTHEVRLLGLDRLSGEIVLEQKRPYGDLVYSIVGRPEKQLVELLFRSGTLRLYFTEKEPADDPMEKPATPGKQSNPGNIPVGQTTPSPADKIRDLFRRLERDISRQLR